MTAKRPESDQLRQLDQLNRALKRASDSYLAYVGMYPSPRLSHYHKGLVEAMAAIAAERARVIAVPPADTRTEEYRRRREYSKFDQEIADKLIAAGLIASVDELEAWRERQRQGSGKSISEQLAEVQQSDRIH